MSTMRKTQGDLKPNGSTSERWMSVPLAGRLRNVKSFYAAGEEKCDSRDLFSMKANVVRALAPLFVFFILVGCAEVASESDQYVKYRTQNDGYVPMGDSGHFSVRDFGQRGYSINKIAYDAANLYMIVCFQPACYHYCRVTAPLWSEFNKKADVGREEATSFYQKYVKVDKLFSGYDCRLNDGKDVPTY